MVCDELTDGTRIGQLLSSEVHSRGRGALGRLAVVDADREVEPTADGAFAYGIEINLENAVESVSSDRIASAYVHPHRLSLEFESGGETALATAKRAGLRVRPEETDPPRATLFVENGAEVKRALGVIGAVAEERLEAIG